ncbi:hypothetical protein KC19_9G040100 [Ceratodon purpureus]|uniref:Uncharacterized protein n=1 Tax=Ceratodon purpureus TaxID=3225 RepID=A0A8T0GNI6_CERPU|nr:hypothetical protein KC19_9G040100 [Ceratodon purpureus]
MEDNNIAQSYQLKAYDNRNLTNNRESCNCHITTIATQITMSFPQNQQVTKIDHKYTYPIDPKPTQQTLICKTKHLKISTLLPTTQSLLFSLNAI